ncbi:odorant receptor 43a-like isoform X1 [Anthonomus grandis grandis]|uniref:odorant receptor 43a-like isoform X1 n=1 Tax=Anthonomus grandis grandis TaxID=2921223 RepID=UPI002165F5D2|nr:odorant receptor 43a-like isoform X1 [Anthonomus grandis grandis]
MAVKISLCRTKKMTVVIKRAIDGVDLTFMGGAEYVNSVYKQYTNYSNNICKLFIVWSFVVGSLLNSYSFIDYVKYLKGRYNDTEKPLHIPCWYPFDINKFYGIVIFYEIFSVYYVDFLNICFQVLFNTLMIQISADLKILQFNFKNFSKNIDTGEELSEEEAYLHFRECVINYQKVIEHTYRLNTELKYVLLVEYGSSSIMLAAVLVQIMQGKMLYFNYPFFGILSFQWGLLAWNANEIVLQSQALAMAIFESNWYEQSKRINQMVIITVLRSRRHLYLSIGPFGEMVIDSAVSRLKLAYSFVSVMS